MTISDFIDRKSLPALPGKALAGIGVLRDTGRELIAAAGARWHAAPAEVVGETFAVKRGPHRCRGCQSDGMREFLNHLQLRMGSSPAANPGRCGVCGQTGAVHNAPLLLKLEKLGLASVSSEGAPVEDEIGALEALRFNPTQQFLHPNNTSQDQKTKLMAYLGGPAQQGPLPRAGKYRPRLAFDDRAMERAYLQDGVNCGPSALAAALGIGLYEAVEIIPRFSDLGYTTEVMMALALHTAGRPFTYREFQSGAPRISSDWPEFGLVRIAFANLDAVDETRLDFLRRSHWIVVSRNVLGQREIFDFNAIFDGGWLQMSVWEEQIVPRLDGLGGAPRSWVSVESFDLMPR